MIVGHSVPAFVSDQCGFATLRPQQPLSIPSCESSGLKIKGGTFLVPAEGEATATVEVETDATVQSIIWDSNGFKMSPVMKLKS